MKRSILSSTAAMAAVIAAPAFADEATQLDEVVVTATRLPAIVAETPGARVIDSRIIEQRGAVFAADILSDVPGLSVTRTGAFGGIAQVRMRGATPGKTLVLVDGAPINDAAEPNGAYDFSSFELADIDRIEVLSGPQSSLWGSDAIGGVISFTTREIDGVRAEAEAGSFDTVRGRLSAGVANETYAFSAYASRFQTDGISAADKADGNPEADGFRSTTLGAKGRYVLSDAVKIDGAVRWNDSHADIDGFPAPDYVLADTGDAQDSEQWSGFARLNAKALGLSHQFSVSASDIDRTSYSGGWPSTFSGDRQAYRWQADGAATGVSYAFGAEREEASGALSSGAARDLATTSVFGVAQYDVGALNLTGGLRYDDTSPQLLNHKALALMERGDYEEGFRLYEHRYRLPEFNNRDFKSAPKWDGKKVGKLAIHGEQGIGDEILFLTQLHKVLPLVDEVAVECTPRLLGLLKYSFRNEPKVKLFPNHELLAKAFTADAWCAMGSLPLLVWPCVHNVFLEPSRAYFRTERPRLGISWRGGTLRTHEYHRNAPLEFWKPLVERIKGLGVDVISLQYGNVNDMAKRLDVPHDADNIQDLDMLASMIKSCDMVLSVCNSTIHMAGGLGVPCTVLVPNKPAWRYGLTGEKSDWYESVNYIRQAKDEGWDSVLARATKHTEEWARNANNRGIPKAKRATA